MGRAARALVVTAEDRRLLETPPAESHRLMPLGLGAFALGTAIAVPLIGPAGLLAMLLPVGMVAYSMLLADAAAERARRGPAGQAARRQVGLRDSIGRLREQVTELQGAAVLGVRQHAHEEQREYQRAVQAFVEALAPAADAERSPHAGS
jgi:hypothetical protein